MFCLECLQQIPFLWHEKPVHLVLYASQRQRAGEATFRFDHGAPTPAPLLHVLPQVDHRVASRFLQYDAPGVCSVRRPLPRCLVVQADLLLQFSRLRRASEPVPRFVFPPVLPKMLRLRGPAQPVSSDVRRWPVEIVSQAREEVFGECVRASGPCRGSWHLHAISVSWREDKLATPSCEFAIMAE